MISYVTNNVVKLSNDPSKFIKTENKFENHWYMQLWDEKLTFAKIDCMMHMKRLANYLPSYV